jgi:ABC-type amino acid transport substrate-binding protein
LTAELARDFERYINQKYKQELGKRPVTVFLIPTTRDRLISGVAEGRADIAAGSITVIPRSDSRSSTSWLPTTRGSGPR